MAHAVDVHRVDTTSDSVIAACFDVLGSPVRLQILRRLRQPAPLTAIDVGGERREAGETLARQTVRRHLDRLIESGIVTVLHRESGDMYVTNHQRVFALSEELRDYARMRPLVEPEAVTVHARSRVVGERVGHQLILVKGLDEGTAYDLAPRMKEWRVGRKRGLDISLDYDPSVSSENAVVRWNGASHSVEDVSGSRNGATHNFRRLAPGEQATLRHGDVIGVGRSLLLYRAP